MLAIQLPRALPSALNDSVNMIINHQAMIRQGQSVSWYVSVRRYALLVRIDNFSVPSVIIPIISSLSQQGWAHIYIPFDICSSFLHAILRDKPEHYTCLVWPIPWWATSPAVQLADLLKHEDGQRCSWELLPPRREPITFQKRTTCSINYATCHVKLFSC
jgi:hypothetical protein